MIRSRLATLTKKKEKKSSSTLTNDATALSSKVLTRLKVEEEVNKWGRSTGGPAGEQLPRSTLACWKESAYCAG